MRSAKLPLSCAAPLVVQSLIQQVHEPGGEPRIFRFLNIFLPLKSGPGTIDDDIPNDRKDPSSKPRISNQIPSPPLPLYRSDKNKTKWPKMKCSEERHNNLPENIISSPLTAYLRLSPKKHG